MRIGLSALFALLLASCASVEKRPDPLMPRPVSVLLVGDSIMGGHLGLYLENTLSAMPGVTAVRHYVVSSGLSGLHEYLWTEAAHDYVRKMKPDVLIVMFGANDSLAVKIATTKGFAHLPSPEFEDQYAMKVRLFLQNTAPYVKKVYWIGQPAVLHRDFTVKYPVLNRIYQTECARFPNAVFIDSWKHTSVDGKYVPRLADKNGTVDLVHWDPVHHTAHGGKVLGELVIDTMARDVSLPWPPAPPTVAHSSAQRK
jgi:hypothetical protein